MIACLSLSARNSISAATMDTNSTAYLPLLKHDEILYEVRGLWVTRFDWTSYGQPANPAKIDEIVQNAANAGFNVIFFQVRGTADAYYDSSFEPWAQRVSGDELGKAPDPYWDPLEYMIEAAHARGIQLHAYINVYPVWDNLFTPPPATTPTHFYHLLEAEHGTTLGKLNGLQWDTGGNQFWDGVYLRSSPASIEADTHYLYVAFDLVSRYDIDGIHLDNIRYGGANTSCDPVSADEYEWDTCPNPQVDDDYADWQRDQVNGTVQKFYYQIVQLKSNLWLSAAVWPIYKEKEEWGWGGTAKEGYYDYYQNSKAWIRDGYIDSLLPMIYPSSYSCPYNGFWTLAKWETLVEFFQSKSFGRYIIPGIGAGYCDFQEISARIELGRQIGTAGHAIFSYGDLLARDYFDDLANGPYAEKALVPPITWRP